MKLNDFLNEFSPTKAIGAIAVILFAVAGGRAIYKNEGPGEALQTFIFIGSGIGLGGLIAKRVTDREYTDIKGQHKVAIAQARASGPPQPSKVTTTTQPEGTTTTEVETPPPGVGGGE